MAMSSTSAQPGWRTRLSSLAHGVSGVATIVDSRTIRLSSFNYDGGGPAVYAYLGQVDSHAAFDAGVAMRELLTRPGQPYVNATVLVTLQEGQTIGSNRALSIWCADFKVNFGSGQFRTHMFMPNVLR